MARHEPFQTLGTMEQELFLQLLKERPVVDGETIAQQGAKATEFFLVKRGPLMPSTAMLVLPSSHVELAI